MTAHQQTKLDELMREFVTGTVRQDPDTESIIVDCYHHVHRESRVVTFRISPSGFRQRL